MLVLSVLHADGVYEPDYINYDLEFSTFANTQSYVQQTMLGKLRIDSVISYISLLFTMSYYK